MSDIAGTAGVIVWTDRSRHGAMASFYRDTLGMVPHSDRAGFINFEWGAFRLTIAVHDGVSGPTTDPGRVMINLEVADIDATHTRLVEAGVTFIRPPEAESWGGRIATFSDPDGNVLQLLQPA